MVKVWYDSSRKSWTTNSWATNSTVSDRVWYRWMSTATPIYSLDSDPWPHWCQVTNASTTYNIRSTEPIWVSWNNNDVGSIHRELNRFRHWERAERLAQRVSDTVEQQEQAREQARRTARQLLVSHLNAEQRETFERAGCFDVISEHGRRYRIFTDRMQHNVFLIDAQGNRLFELCCHVTGVPLYDNAIAQKLYLEYMEDEFLRTANIWDRRGGRSSATVSREGERFEFPDGLGQVQLGPEPVTALPPRRLSRRRPGRQSVAA